MSSDTSSIAEQIIITQESAAPKNAPTPPLRDQSSSSISPQLSLSKERHDEEKDQISGSVGPYSTGLPKTAPESITLLTYNLSLGPWCSLRRGEGQWKEKRLEEWIRQGKMEKLDVLCLQGVFSQGSKRQRRLLAAAREQGLLFSMYSPKESLLQGKVDGGLVILSRYPIIASASHTYDRGQGRDR